MKSRVRPERSLRSGENQAGLSPGRRRVMLWWERGREFKLKIDSAGVIVWLDHGIFFECIYKLHFGSVWHRRSETVLLKTGQERGTQDDFERRDVV